MTLTWYAIAVLTAMALTMSMFAAVSHVTTERLVARMRRAVRRSRVRGALFLSFMSPHAMLRIAGIAPIAGGDGTEIDPAELRLALGIGDAGDPVAAIKNMQTEIAELKAMIASDKGKADMAELGRVRSALTQANQKILSLETEFNNKIAVINADRHQEQAVAKVDALIARGKIRPVYRETALDLAINLSAEKFDAYVATLHNVDLSERGVASGSELADLEPTATEIAIAKQMGTWDASKPNESRMALMRTKAQDRGLEIPAEVK